MPAKPSQSEQLYRNIFDAVLTHKLTPGTRLTEQELSEVFQVSRTVTRRALQRLALEGVVDLRPNRGAVVAHTSVREAREIFEARRLLEGAIARLACERMTPDYGDTLREISARERQAFAQGDRGEGLRQSAEFHMTLAVIAGNTPLQSYTRNLMTRAALVVAQYERPNPAHCPYDEHPMIIDALESGDVDKVTQLMGEHLQHIEHNLDLDDAAEDPPLAQIFTQAAPIGPKA